MTVQKLIEGVHYENGAILEKNNRCCCSRNSVFFDIEKDTAVAIIAAGSPEFVVDCSRLIQVHYNLSRGLGGVGGLTQTSDGLGGSGVAKCAQTRFYRIALSLKILFFDKKFKKK